MADYGKLRTVLLGTVANYLPHVWGWPNGSNEELFVRASEIAMTAIPKEVIEEVAEDLEEFGAGLSKLGIGVIRPPESRFDHVSMTESHFAFGNDFYNLRDLQIVIDKLIIAASPPSPSRVLECERLEPFLMNVATNYGLTFVKAPLPKLVRDPSEEYFFESGQLRPIEESIGRQLGGDYPEIWHRLIEDEILFEAANVARFRDLIIYLVSSTGNAKGFEWIQKNKPKQYAAHSTNVYRSSHIDSTIMPLSDSQVLVNAARVNPGNLPEPLLEKEVIYFDEVAPIPEEEREFHGLRKSKAAEITALGFHTNLSEMSSPWAGLNVLVLDKDLVAVESRQTSLMRVLESHGFSVMPVRYRHPYTFLGGLHCTTLDIHREYDSE
jgi:glycine amidinotransferase/scyllo-inosamine-4-phosphate amidinotransferase 1